MKIITVRKLNQGQVPYGGMPGAYPGVEQMALLGGYEVRLVEVIGAFVVEEDSQHG